MYHGEDLAKHATASAMIGSSQRVYAEDQALNVGRTVRPPVSIAGMISQSEELQKYAVDRLHSVDGLAARAGNIVARIAGQFEPPQPKAGPAMSGEKSTEVSSALDALQRTITDARRPLAAMDDPFQRLSAAFDALERAIG